MSSELPRIISQQKTGAEQFHFDNHELGISVLDFWRWSTSDLLSNATRGKLAEFIVATALGISVHGVRDEWDAYDLFTPEGIRIEVKSAAYLQSWHQKKVSGIIFCVPKTRSWNAEANLLDNQVRRQADVYVFALLNHTDKATVNPLNLEQWSFFVLLTTVLDSRKRSQHSITLPTLHKLSGGPVSYHDLGRSVRAAVDAHVQPF